MRDIQEIVNDMPPIVRDCIKGLNQAHNAPMEMVIPMVLSTASLGAQLKYKLKLNYKDDIPLCLWSIILADSGTRKSSVQGNLLKPLTNYEESQIEPYEVELETYEFDLALWKKDRMAKNPQGLLRPSKPISPDVMTPTGTLNGVINHLAHNSFGALITSEGSQFFDGHSMLKSSGKREEMTSNLNALFTGDIIAKMTGVERIKLVNRQFVISLMTQPNLATILNDKKLQDQGFWARFMITQTPPSKQAIGGYKHCSVKVDHSAVNEKMIYPLGNAVVDMIREHKRRLKNHIDQEGTIGGLQYSTITLNDKSGKINDDWEDSYLGPKNTAASLGATIPDNPFLQRIQQFGVKIAAVLSAFNNSTTISGSTDLNSLRAKLQQSTITTEIQPEEALIGFELAEWFYEQRLHLEIEDSENVSDTVNIADDLLVWLEKKNITKISKSDLDRKGMYKYRKQTKEVRQKIIEELLSVGKLTSAVVNKKLNLEVVK